MTELKRVLESARRNYLEFVKEYGHDHPLTKAAWEWYLTMQQAVKAKEGEDDG